MDEFDAVDIVYNAVAAAGTDVMIYKDKSEAACIVHRTHGRIGKRR